MIKQYAIAFRRLMITADIGCIVAAFYLAFSWRNSVEPLYPLRDYLWMLPIIIMIWWGGLWSLGIFESYRFKSAFELAGRIVFIGVVGLGMFSTFNYLLRIDYVSRTLAIWIFALSTLFLVLVRTAQVIVLRTIRPNIYNFRNILVVGTGPRAEHFIRQVHEHREIGLNITGVIDADESRVGLEVEGYKVIGTLKDISSLLVSAKTFVDQVVFIVPRKWLDRIQEPVLFCETIGIPVSVAVDLFDLHFVKGKETSLMGMPFIDFDSTPDKVGQLALKRGMDVVLSAAAMLFLAPLFAVIAAFIKMTSPGPVFFSQERSCLNGRVFKLYKFRTMYKDAEARRQELVKLNEMQGPVFKIKDDPRITPIGKILRRFSLDELPQLWNIFKGDMSIVGPRPPLPDEVRKYDLWQRRRLSMRPGLTCIWQVSGRNKIKDFDRWMKLDLEYIDNWSIWLDLKLILLTIPVVLLGIGAE